MENKCKRFLSLLLALVMVIGLMPMTSAHAEETAFYISEDELLTQSMELLGIVREALISLTIAVFLEEKKRKAKRGDNEKIVPLHLYSYDDEWKI